MGKLGTFFVGAVLTIAASACADGIEEQATKKSDMGIWAECQKAAEKARNASWEVINASSLSINSGVESWPDTDTINAQNSCLVANGLDPKIHHN